MEITVAGDKGFDTVEFVAECRHMNVTPHVAQNAARPGGSAIDSPVEKPAGSQQYPRLSAFNNLDATYNSFLSGLTAPNATTGQPLLSSVLQGFRIRALMSCTLDPEGRIVHDSRRLPACQSPLIAARQR